LLNTLLQAAALVSARIAAGTLDQSYLDALESSDAAARARQIEARDQAKEEGR
jgi:hypothetical protein